MHKTITLLSLLALLGTTACETVQGAGRDLQSAGHAVTAESRDAQAKM